MGEHLVSEYRYQAMSGIEAYRMLLGKDALPVISTPDEVLLRHVLMGKDDGWVYHLMQGIGRFDELRWGRLLAFLHTCSARKPPAWPWDQIVGRLRPVAQSSSPGLNDLVRPAKRMMRDLGY